MIMMRMSFGMFVIVFAFRAMLMLSHVNFVV